MTTSPIEAGFAQKVISPEKGVSLQGYFANRYNRGVRDDLYAKAMVLSDGNTTGAIVVVDNALVVADVVETIRHKLKPHLDFPCENVFVQATHTHTAPALQEGAMIDFSPAYSDYFIEQSVAAVLQAHSAMQPVTFAIAESVEDRVAFCRRFIMRDGTVVTNPVKDSPDYYFAVLEVKNLAGKIIAVLVHCTNHTDAIGDDMVSADWPGVLCTYLTDNINSHPQAMLLNGMAGNVNQVDITNLEQTVYGPSEAERIGTLYGQTALELLQKQLQPLDVSEIAMARTVVELPRLELTQQQIDEAEALVANTPIPQDLTVMHSPDLAKNNQILKSLLARQQLAFHHENKSSEPVEVGAMRIGELLMVGLPFEPFSEIAVDIRSRSPFKYTFALELLNGAYFYLATKDAAERTGGLETIPGFTRLFVPQAAPILTDAAEELAKSLAQ